MTRLNLQTKPRLTRGTRLHVDVKTGEPVLIFPEGLFQLSETARDIVARCDGDLTIQAIISVLAENYEVEAATLERDICECLLELRQHNLVVFE